MAELRAGYGEAVITPPLGSVLTGFGWYLDRRGESLLDDLKARALMLDDGAQRLLLVTCDLLGFTVDWSDAARADLAADHGLPRKNVLLACTHTHTGPATMPLPGVADTDEAYLEALRPLLAAAAHEAASDLAPAQLSYAVQRIEPLAYNRRLDCFEPVDPCVRLVRLERADRNLLLLNYACHPTTLAAAPVISADWPGAVVRELERGGDRALLFQGFCGDLNTVTRSPEPSRWAENLAFYGRTLAARVRYWEPSATRDPDPYLRAVEHRLDLPLDVPEPEALDRDLTFWTGRPGASPGERRYLPEWAARAQAERARWAADPWIRGVPVQALALGSFRFLGLPGEVFCEFGLRLRERWPLLATCGCSGGNVGYLCTREAYQHPADYAAYLAPKLYHLFPFSPDTEDLVLQAGRNALSAVD